jgi:hypothetical protein
MKEIQKKNENWQKFIEDCKSLTDVEHVQEVVKKMTAEVKVGVK